MLYRLEVEHPWRDEAEAWCWQAVDADVSDGAHTLSEVLVFLEHVPALSQRFTEMPDVHLDPQAPGYGLSPLHFAPTADARWRQLFTDAQIDAALDHLQRSQQPDGGWPLTWEPPGETARLEWRGIVTLRALRSLSSYGRLSTS